MPTAQIINGTFLTAPFLMPFYCPPHNTDILYNNAVYPVYNKAKGAWKEKETHIRNTATPKPTARNGHIMRLKFNSIEN